MCLFFCAHYYLLMFLFNFSPHILWPCADFLMFRIIRHRLSAHHLCWLQCAQLQLTANPVCRILYLYFFADNSCAESHVITNGHFYYVLYPYLPDFMCTLFCAERFFVPKNTYIISCIVESWNAKISEIRIFFVTISETIKIRMKYMCDSLIDMEDDWRFCQLYVHIEKKPIVYPANV